MHVRRGLTVADTNPYIDENDYTNREEWCLVSWEPKWECARAFCHKSNPEQCKMADDYDRTHDITQPPTRSHHKRQDEHKSNSERQGHWLPQGKKIKQPFWHDPSLKQHIHIHPNDSIKLDQDITPPGKFTLAIREEAETSEGPRVNVYDNNGKVTGVITLKRLDILHAAFKHAQATAPDTMQQLKAECFEHEVAKLLIRYQEGYCPHKSKHWQCTKLENHIATPDEYMHALKVGLDIDCERFASPLNFNPEIPQYYSMYEQDRVFGANFNAFSSKWTGASQAKPEFEPEAMEKALRWAILSAEQSDSASLTAFIMPDTPSTGFYKWLQHPTVMPLCKIGRNSFRFKTADHWKSGQTYNGHTKSDVIIFLVANDKGLSLVDDARLRQQLQAAAVQHAGHHVTMHNIERNNQPDDELIRGLYEPKQFPTATYDMPHSWIDSYNHEHESLRHILTHPPKRYDPTSMVYTDGNYKKDTNLAGAGVYTMKDGDEVRIKIRPSKPGPVHTINRAELIAIYMALDQWREDSNLVIATDSANAMKGINRQLRNPQQLKYHVHKYLLKAIGDVLIERARLGLQSSIIKVKSHIGVQGNTIADAVAGEATASAEIDLSGEHTEPYKDMAWLRRVEKDQEGNDCDGQFLRNLNDSLQEALHNKHKLGQSNQDAKYVQYWRNVQEHVLADISNGYWDETTITDPAKRNTNKYKWGQLWHMGKAWLYKVPYMKGQDVVRNCNCPVTPGALIVTDALWTSHVLVLLMHALLLELS